MPLAGRMDSDTPILMNACRPTTTANPDAASCAKVSRALAARSSSRIVTKPNSKRDQDAERDAEFLARDRKDEIRVGVGKPVFDRARAGSHAGKAAGFERLKGETGLIAGSALHELRDAFAHMGMEEIGDDREPRTAGTQRGKPVVGKTGEEQHHHAQGPEQQRLPDIGLQQQHDQSRRQQPDGHELAGEAALQFVGEEGGGENREGGLEELGRLQPQSAEIEPAMSAVDVDARDEREPGADQAEREDAGRQDAHGFGIEHRRADQDADGGRREGELLQRVGEVAGACRHLPVAAGLAANASTSPIAIRPSMPANVIRSMVHHQREKPELSARERIMKRPLLAPVLAARRSAPARDP